MKRISYIVRKELLESIRDTRTFLMVVIMPLFLYPVLFIGMGYYMNIEKKKEKEIIYTVGIVNPDSSPEFMACIKKNKRIKTIEGKNPEEMFKNRGVESVIEIKSKRKIAEYLIYYDGADRESKSALNRIKGILSDYKKETVEKRLAREGLSEKILEPFTVEEHNLATAERMGGFLLGTLIPYLLIIVSFSGAMHTSSDIVTGEKERRTLETLLVTNVKRGEVVTGKICTIFIISFITGVSALIGLILTFYTGFSVTSGTNAMGAFSIPWSSVLLMLVVLLPLLWLFSSLLLTIGSIAKNMKEADTNSTYLLFFVIMLAVFSIMRLTSPGWKLFFIPVLNTAILQQQILIGKFNIFSFSSTIGSSLLYAFIVFLLAKSIFEKEEILYRS